MRRDDALLLDMLLAARKIRDFMRDISETLFYGNEMLKSAVIREIQVIGEASRMVTDETKTIHQNIDWQRIIGMRNCVIHEYFDIRLKAVWDTVQNDIPVLIEQLEKIVPPEDDI